MSNESIYQISKDLGIATAYGYAVSKGYEGTEDEFAELMASYADIGQQAIDAVTEATQQAELAEGYASDAEVARTDAISAKDIAVGAKDDAISAKNTAVLAETAATEKALAASNSATSASNSAATAVQKASEASGSATSASGSADIATQKATDASNSATNAANSASDALASKNAAATSETNAATSEMNAANSASDALASKNAAATSETNAATSETNAANSATNAAGSASTASTKASEAAESATNAADSASTASTKATEAAASAQAAQDVLDSIPDDYTELTEKVAELDETKANIDGYYEQMTVGDAEQLVATVGVEDDTPYLFRTAGGSADIGDRVTRNFLEGVSVVWNQLVQNGNFADGTTGWDKTTYANLTVADGKMTVSCTSLSNREWKVYRTIPTIPTNHKCLVGGKIQRHLVDMSPGGPSTYGAYLSGATTSTLISISLPNVNDIKDFSTIVSTSEECNQINIKKNSGKPDSTGAIFTIWDIQVFDLTQMFGSTIADYIYSLEQATAGAGVAFFRSIFPKPYYAYNAGEIMSIQAAKAISRGFNAYDHANGTARLVGGSQYQITGTYTSITFEDGTTITPDADGYFIPAKTGAISVASGNSTDTCVHLVWDGERDGEYEPYKANEYTLGEVVLRGIPKLENGKIFYDGDTYESDGTVTRKYGLIDLGSLTWSYNTTYNVFYTGGFGSLAKADGLCACTKYIRGSTGASNQDKVMQIGKTGWFVNYFVIKDTAYSDTATFKSSLSGVYLVYELATPTTEEADPWSNPQTVDDFGTEEFVEFGDRDVQIPVGHSSMYQANLRAKLEMAPNSPDGDGDYIVRQTEGTNEYVPLHIATADAMARKADIDGNYPDMTVGNAEQLISTVGNEDSAPYNYRTAGGSADIGDREELKCITGVSLPWNQLVRDEASDNTTDFADIVSVTDATADSAAVSVKLEPVQDLHGYENPWPAGGGKNLFNQTYYSDINNYSTGYSGYNYTDPVMLKPNTTYTFDCTPALDLETATYYVVRAVAGDDPEEFYSDDSYVYPVYAGKSASASARHMITTGETGAVRFGLPANHDLSLIMNANWQLEESSTATTWTPYSNICPITGWDEVNVTRTGKNLFNQSATPTLMNCYTDSGNITVRRAYKIELQSGTYTFSATKKTAETDGAYMYINICNKDDSFNYFRYFIAGATTQATYTRTLTDGQYVLLYDAQASTDSSINKFDYFDFQVELGSTATDYEAYSGQTYDISFPVSADTVYGGQLTVNKDGTGTIVADKAQIIFNGTGKVWSTYNSYEGFAIGIQDMNAGTRQDGFCNWAKVAQGGFAGPAVWLGVSNNNLYIIKVQSLAGIESSDTDSDKLTKWYSYLSSNPLQLVYPLAQPQTYTLTAAEVTTLLGENHIWSDAGQVSLTYTGTHEFLTLQNGRKYLTHLDGTDAMVAGTGQTIEAVKGTDNVFDLTQMWGSSVADVAYAQGPAWFRKYFPKAKYLYNAGTLKHVQTSGHKMTGFNQWDEEMELGYYDVNTGVKKATTTQVRSKNPIPVLPNTRYFVISSKGLWGLFYDGDGKLIEGWSATAITAGNASLIYGSQSVDGFLTPPNAASMSFYAVTEYGTTYKHDICINLSWDGERDGEYEPYAERVYPLDDSVELHGVPKLDASNNLYYDGDTYEADGTVTRKYAVVDLGTLTWQTGWSGFYTYDVKVSTTGDARGKMMCDSYVTTALQSGTSETKYISAIYGGAGYASNGYIYVKDPNYSTAADFKAGVSGVFLVYELETPTTEEAEEYQELQIVDDFGTEEFIDERDIPIPVGHTTIYQPNLRAKLEMAPDSPSDNGDYIVRHVNGQNEYVALPTMPMGNGKYALKVTVTNGTPTLVWEVDS